MDQNSPSRRQFMAAVGNLASVSWVTLYWPQIAQAAEQAEHAGHDHHMGGAPVPAPAGFTTLAPAEAADVDAIANQIVPGGDLPGARDAKVVHFIDNSLGSFWAEQLPSFRKGLAAFQAAWKSGGSPVAFAAAPDEQQIAFLRQVDHTAFFLAVRRLTVLGLIAWPKYGGNFENLGWKLLGVEDNHVWTPPFGYYDVDYPGFKPYPGTKPYTTEGAV